MIRERLDDSRTVDLAWLVSIGGHPNQYQNIGAICDFVINQKSGWATWLRWHQDQRWTLIVAKIDAVEVEGTVLIGDYSKRGRVRILFEALYVPNTEETATSDTVGDLVMLVRRLARAVKRIDPESKLHGQALDYLRRKNLDETSPLREKP